MKDSIKQLVKEQVVQRLVRSFSEATGLRVAIFDARGEPLLEVEDYFYHVPFCELVNSLPEGAARCRDTHLRACRQAYGLCDPYIFFCHAGLVHWAVPILVQNQVRGVMICGQVLMWELDNLAIEEICNKVKDLNLPEAELKEAIWRIQVVAARKVQAAVELLKIVASHIASTIQERWRFAVRREEEGEVEREVVPGAAGRDERGNNSPRYREENESLPWESSVNGVALWSWLVASEPWRQGDSYQLNKEEELAARVRLGDRLGAEAILDELLGNILFVGISRPETIKFRLLELLAILSRAAVAGGAALQLVLDLNGKYMQGLSRASLEESILGMAQALDVFMNSIYAGKETKSLPVIERAIAFINKNFSRNISVEDVAKTVGVSPAHLTRLFKQEVGRTLIEYLTLVRMEHAKVLLRQGRLTLEEICRQVGYNDVSYFSRVFKREIGVTPGVFRSRYCHNKE